MITLLPEIDRSHVRVEYRLRLAAVTGLMGAGALFIGSAALVPSFVEAHLAEAAAQEDARITLRAADNPSFKDAEESLRASQVLLAAVEGQAAAPRLSAALVALMAVRPAALSVTRVECSAADAGAMQVRLSGVASTREALLQFRQALQELPNVSSVDLPVDTLAKSTDVAFALSVFVTPAP